MQTSSPDYPIQLALPEGREINRWWGLFGLGQVARFLLCIPHLLVLIALGIAVMLGSLIMWIPILLFGRVPTLWCRLGTEIITRSARVSAYFLYLFPGDYPALGAGEAGPLEVQIKAGDTSINRLWGIPFFGAFARFVVLIPHLVVLGVLGTVTQFIAAFVWIPVLINGRYPEIAIKVVGLTLRYQARVTAYLLMLPVPYLPFDFEM